MAYDAYKPFDYEKQYNAQADALKKAYEAQYQAQKQQYEAQIPKVNQQYDQVRSQALANARINALGNNEALAAQGLSGNAYQGPASGYSEAARVSESNALRNALARATQNEQGAVDDINAQIGQIGLARDAALANALQQIEAQRLQSAQNENQFAANFNFNAQQADQAAALQQQQMDYQKQQDAYNKAMQELSVFGRIVTQAAANALGMPLGTTLSGMQAAKSGGRSRGGTPRAQAQAKAEDLETVNSVLAALSKLPGVGQAAQGGTPAQNLGAAYGAAAGAGLRAGQSGYNYLNDLDKVL